MLDNLNRLLDSFIEEENDKAREGKRRNDHHHQNALLARAMEVINGRDQVTTLKPSRTVVKLKLA
jgi:hypothetical protein